MHVWVLHKVGIQTWIICFWLTITDDDLSIQLLNQTTHDSFNYEKVRLVYVAAQVANIDMKVSCAIIETMQVYRDVLGTAAGLGLIPGAPSSNRTVAATSICRAILKCFGFPTVSPRTVWEIIKLNVWDDLGHNVAIACAEAIATLGLLATIGLGGMPVFLGSGTLNLPLVVPATTRLMLLLATDLILILARAFKEATYTCVGQPGVKDLESAAKWYRPLSVKVHKEILELVPKRNFVKSFRCDNVRLGLEKIVQNYKEQVMENTTSDLSRLNIKASNGDKKTPIGYVREEIRGEIVDEMGDLPRYDEAMETAQKFGFGEVVKEFVVQTKVQA